MTDLITLGELLIDLTQMGVDENGCGQFTAYPGGAPANVAAAASRLGAKAAFIGKVGNDAFGRSLADTLEKEGVDTVGLSVADGAPTTLAIVSVDENGERDFSFYRDPGADTQLTEDEAVETIDCLFNEPIDKDISEISIEDIKMLPAEKCPVVLHVGSLSMTTSPAREACTEAVDFAKSRGMLISYDPNYRAALWDSEERAVEMMKSLMPFADILKVSDEEMEMLTGTSDLEEGSRILRQMGRPAAPEAGPKLSGSSAADGGISLVMVTLGADGVFLRSGDRTAKVPGFSVKVADTNGAGDTFLGAMLMQLTRRIKELYRDNTADNHICLKAIGWDELLAMVSFANKAASVTCSRSGAIPAMPYAAELE